MLRFSSYGLIFFERQRGMKIILVDINSYETSQENYNVLRDKALEQQSKYFISHDVYTVNSMDELSKQLDQDCMIIDIKTIFSKAVFLRAYESSDDLIYISNSPADEHSKFIAKVDLSFVREIQPHSLTAGCFEIFPFIRLNYNTSLLFAKIIKDNSKSDFFYCLNLLVKKAMINPYKLEGDFIGSIADITDIDVLKNIYSTFNFDLDRVFYNTVSLIDMIEMLDSVKNINNIYLKCDNDSIFRETSLILKNSGVKFNGEIYKLSHADEIDENLIDGFNCLLVMGGEDAINYLDTLTFLNRLKNSIATILVLTQSVEFEKIISTSADYYLFHDEYVKQLEIKEMFSSIQNVVCSCFLDYVQNNNYLNGKNAIYCSSAFIRYITKDSQLRFISYLFKSFIFSRRHILQSANLINSFILVDKNINIHKHGTYIHELIDFLSFLQQNEEDLHDHPLYSGIIGIRLFDKGSLKALIVALEKINLLSKVKVMDDNIDECMIASIKIIKQILKG